MNKMNWIVAAASVMMLTACGNRGWAYYESAQTCYMVNGDVCGEKYEKAIKEKPEMPGVHSSYATWLLREGRTDEAQAQYELEIAAYPFAKKSVLTATQSKQAKTSEPVVVTEETPAPSGVVEEAPKSEEKGINQ